MAHDGLSAMPRTRRTSTVAVVVLVAGGQLLAFADPGRPPDAWDPRVAPLVEWLEEARGLEFAHPVAVTWRDPAEVIERARSDRESLSAEDLETFQDALAELRALGLTNDDLDPSSDAADHMATRAFYISDPERVVVTATEMTPEVELALIHELTHALQRQHFQVPGAGSSNPAISNAADALVEGDAIRMEDQYALAQGWYDLMTPRVHVPAQAGTDIGTVADAVGLEFHTYELSRYTLGPPFVRLIEAVGGPDAVDDALDVRLTEEDILDPWPFATNGGQREPSAQVPQPTVDGVTDLARRPPLGPLTWYLLLAARVEPRVALEAVDGWGGDAAAVLERDENRCVAAVFVGDSPEETAEMRDALRRWAAGGTATVTPRGNGVQLLSCDGGSGSATPIVHPPEHTILLPALRVDLAAQLVSFEGVDAATARCAVDRHFERLTFDALLWIHLSIGTPPPVPDPMVGLDQLLRDADACSEVPNGARSIP